MVERTRAPANDPASERERIAAYLDAEGAICWDRNLGGALQRFADWIRRGEHWRELQAEPHIYDTFMEDTPDAPR